MNKSSATQSFEERAVQLLSSGISASKVAEICDVDPSRISQLMDETGFKEKLTEAKFDRATKYNTIDDKLDTLEETVIDKLADSLSLIMDPMKLSRVLQVVNGAKRRGTSILGGLADSGQIVQLILPIKVTNTFVLNQVNQVVQAGGEDLLTIQPSQMKELLNGHVTRQAASIEDKHLPWAVSTSSPESV